MHETSSHSALAQMNLRVDNNILESALESRGPIINSTDALYGNVWSHFSATALNVFGEKQVANTGRHWIVCTQGRASELPRLSEFSSLDRLTSLLLFTSKYGFKQR